ncbi:MAG: hypothetical protein ACRESS_12335 [Stenotrophobium sp.]
MHRLVDSAANGFALIAVHEADALRGLRAALAERLAVARRARTPGELLRDQFDLLPETRLRFVRDQQVRGQLWRGLLQDMTAPLRKAA